MQVVVLVKGAKVQVATAVVAAGKKHIAVQAGVVVESGVTPVPSAMSTIEGRVVAPVAAQAMLQGATVATADERGAAETPVR